MKKGFLILLLCPLLLLSACSLPEDTEEPFSAAFTIRPPETATERFFDVPLSTEPGGGKEVSALLPDGANTLGYDDLRSLLAQSMFTAENEEGTVALWTQQIRYTMEGDCTQEDRDLLADMARDLTQIAAFPGMRETDDKSANVIVHLTDVPNAQLTYTRDENGALTKGEITIPSKLLSSKRQALLAEKMFRLFGFFYPADTSLESVLAEQEPAAYMSEADLILLEIVYGQMHSGMTRAECMQSFTEYFTQS